MASTPAESTVSNAASLIRLLYVARGLRGFGDGFAIIILPAYMTALGYDAVDGIIADDVVTVLPRLARKGEKFDVIILDPPTFSRSPGGKTFHVENDFEKLLVASLELTERNSHVLVSTNCSTLGEHALEVMARYGFKAARRAGSFHRSPPLPDFPPGTGASSIWLTLR